MSSLKITVAAKDGKKGKGRLENVVLAYVKIKNGDTKYQSEKREYVLDCVVDKKTAKAFKKEFPKNGYKEIDTVDFEDKFKFVAPFPDEDEQFIVKVRTNAQFSKDIDSAGMKAGDLIPYSWGTRPKVYQPTDGGVKDITNNADKQVANGSVGSVAFTTLINDFGHFLQLSSVLVTDLIPYTAQDSESEWGGVVGGLVDDGVITAPEDTSKDQGEEAAAIAAESEEVIEEVVEDAKDPFA